MFNHTSRRLFVVLFNHSDTLVSAIRVYFPIVIVNVDSQLAVKVTLFFLL